MARIRRSKDPKGSNYERILGDRDLAKLITKIHATSISAGTELEKILYEKARYKIENPDQLDSLIKEDKNHPTNKGVYIVNKRTIKKSRILKSNKESDFLGLNFKDKTLYIIEVKDGENFDTKKSLAERENLVGYRDFVAHKILFKSTIHICLFNTKDKIKAAKQGLKNVFQKSEVLTGKELCILFDMDFDAIIDKRRNDIQDNLGYIYKELTNWLKKSKSNE